MNKKIITIVSILAFVAVALVVAVAIQNMEAPVEVEQTSMKKVKQSTVADQKVKPTGDADIDSINKDLDEVSDEDFGDATLSDAEVGL